MHTATGDSSSNRKNKKTTETRKTTRKEPTTEPTFEVSSPKRVNLAFWKTLCIIAGEDSAQRHVKPGYRSLLLTCYFERGERISCKGKLQGI